MRRSLSSALFFVFLMSLDVGTVMAYRVGSPEGSTTHYIIREYFATQAEALAACHAFTARHGYTDNYCNRGQDSYVAGNLWHIYNVETEPFELGIFYFNVVCLDEGFEFTQEFGCSCLSHQACSDGSVCNGEEQCEGIGRCVDGEPLDCSIPDGLTCATRSCQEPIGCVYDVDTPAECTCDAPPPVTRVTHRSAAFESPAQACPLVGGTVQYGLTLDGQLSLEDASCANNCTSNTSAAANLTLALGVCGGTITVKGTGTHALQRAGCVDCAPETCEKFCKDGTCDTETSGGAVAVSYSQSYGSKFNAKNRVLEFSAKCDSTLSIGGGAEKSLTSVLNNGSTCNTCDSCSKEAVSGNITAGAQADCMIELRAARFTHKLGCVSCGALELKGSVSNETEVGEGACGGLDCTSTRVDGKMVISTPKFASKTAWWDTDIQCQATLNGCSEYNSCNSLSCKDNDADTDGVALKTQLSCNVRL